MGIRIATVNQLYDIVHKLVVDGHGRKPVYVDKQSFQDNREADGCVFMPALQGYLHTFPRMDDDGGIAERKDGSERTITAFLIVGHSGRTGS
jgi:hypothetical protein